MNIYVTEQDRDMELLSTCLGIIHDQSNIGVYQVFMWTEPSRPISGRTKEDMRIDCGDMAWNSVAKWNQPLEL
jgi:hypothetical protein